MHGARLFLYTDNQQRGARWREALRARMRARKWFDRYPGFDVALQPHAAGYAQHQLHVDRLHARELNNLGSGKIDLDLQAYDEPAAFPLEELKYTIDEWLGRAAGYLDRAESVARFEPHGWGSVFPDVLFVGDQYDGDRAAERPFSDATGASTTLTKLLNVADIPEARARFVNAYSRLGAAQLTLDAVRRLAARKVVALGTQARDYLRYNLAVPRIVEFPHPKYIAEFSPVPVARWGAKLKELLA